MRHRRHYTKALVLCQAAITITYLIIRIVVYLYCGSYVSSPALGSTGSLIKKISYGIAIPGLLASSTLSIHVCFVLMDEFLCLQGFSCRVDIFSSAFCEDLST